MSVRLWDELLAAEPRLADELGAGHRYAAACAAAHAASAKGSESPPLDRAERERLRRQARIWLEADLTAISRAMEKGSGRERSSGRSRLGRWLVATQLAGVRDPNALEALSATERGEWKAFWAKVEGTIKRGMPKAGSRSGGSS